MYDSRKYIFQIVILIVGFIFLSKLFAIQVVSKTYRDAATSNIIKEVTEYPYRGLIYGRNGEQIVVNTPEFDLYVTPKDVETIDTLALCKLLRISIEDFNEKLDEAKSYSYVKASSFESQIPLSHYGQIQDQLLDFPGFEIRARTSRDYPLGILSNAIGYTAEISKTELNRDDEDYYSQGDYIGKSGLEASYEKELRGRRGKTYKLKNVSGIEMGDFDDGKFNTMAIPGLSIHSTIDVELQQYAEKLMEGKIGSVVAIEPATGEILTLVSAPDYNPNLLVGRDFSGNFNSSQKDSLVPLFNRPIMAMYPPGSIFKTVQALVGLQQGVVDPNELIYVDNSLIGDHAPPGLYDLHEAIKLSSNNYFFMTFRKIIEQNVDANRFIDARHGLEQWQEMVMKFGLGQPLGIDIPNEKGGQIPGLSVYDNVYGENRWKFSNISSLSIGQGEILLSPLQMANLASILANRGFYYTPHLVKGIGDEMGPRPEYLQRQDVGIDEDHFPIVIDAMEAALKGTAWRAVIPGITTCGKTGTAENPHGADHSVFMAFAPKEDPKIAISVYVENSGWGGRAAASTASLIIEKYLKGNVDRKWLEGYVLIGDFLDEETD